MNEHGQIEDVAAPKPDRHIDISILPKTYDPATGMIRFRTGPIPGNPDYALKKDGAVVRTGPRILSKKERKRDKRAQAEFTEGYRFICTCKALTFHYPSKTRVRIPGYEKWQDMETYKCAACGEHFDREKIDAAVAAHAERTKKITDPTLSEPYDTPT